MTGGVSSATATASELKTINPATEEVINTYKIITKEQIDAKVKTSRTVFSEGLLLEKVTKSCGKD